MTTNLLTLLEEQFDDNAINHLSQTLGETPAVISKALDGVLPAVVGGVAQHSKDPGAPASLLSLLQASAPYPSLGESFTDSTRTQTAVTTGNTLLTRIFGNKINRIVDTIATYSGAKSTSITSLLGLAASSLMGLLTRQSTGTSALTAGGLTSTLEGQADIVGNAMPVALRSLLSLIGITVVGTETTTIKHSTPTTPVAAVEPDKGTPWLRWLLILLGILLLLWLLRSCLGGDKKETTTVVTDSTTTMATPPVTADTVASATGGAMTDSAQTNGPAVQVDVELPGGRRLKVAERSFNAALADYLSTKPRAPFRTFTFDNLKFATNSAAIDAESQTHVNELIEIMKAYPALVIRIEGHTDNTGSEATNETLSQERADAVKAALVKAGVTADRVSTKGFAAEKPTATNKTSEGRHENRRIDVVVVNA